MAATDFTKWTATLATDFTKPTTTDITKVLMTDFTKVRDNILGRYTHVGTRGCPPWDFKDGSFPAGRQRVLLLIKFSRHYLIKQQYIYRIAFLF